MKIKPVCRNSIGIKSCSLSLLSLSVRTFPSWLLLLKHLSSLLLVQTGTEVTGAPCAGGEGAATYFGQSHRPAAVPGRTERLLAGLLVRAHTELTAPCKHCYVSISGSTSPPRPVRSSRGVVQCVDCRQVDCGWRRG